MKVAIIVNFGFPRGMASASRARHLAQGLIANGAEVEVVVPKPTESAKEPLNAEVKGIFEKIKYTYTTNTIIVPENRIKRRLVIIAGFWKCAGYIYKKRKSYDVVILYLRETSSIAFIATVCRLLRIKTILELCEWPAAQEDLTIWGKIRIKILSCCMFWFVDAVLVISSFLEKCVADFSHERILRHCLLVPILVDTEKYKCPIAYKSSGDLLFSGMLDQIKIVLFLLDVMNELVKRGLKRRLLIIGKALNENNLRIIKKKIEYLNLNEFVALSGYISDQELKDSYCTAAALLAPLPAGNRSEARFPTKIGEYLATGRPVVTTNIGDIPKYLVDKESAYLTKPDDVNDFTDTIIEVLNNPKQAELVGQQGKNVADLYFNPFKEGKKITNFIRALNN